MRKTTTLRVSSPVGRLGLRVAVFAVAAAIATGLAACATSPAASTAAAQREGILQQAMTQVDVAQKAVKEINEKRGTQMLSDGLVTPPESVGVDGVQLVLTTGHPSGISDLSISADGRYVASSDTSQVKIWDLAAHNEVRSFDVRQNGLGSAAQTVHLSPDGRAVLERPQDSTISRQMLRDCATGNLIEEAQLISDDGKVSVDLGPPTSPPAHKSSGSGVAFTVTDLATHHQTGLFGQTGTSLLAMSPHGDIVLTNEVGVESGGGARDVASGILGLASLVASVIPGANLLTKLATGMASDAVGDAPTDQRMTLVAWDAHSGRKLLSLQTTRMSNITALDGAGKQLLVENADRSVDAYELPSTHKRRVVPADPDFKRPAYVRDTLLLSPDGRQFARASQSRAVEIYDTNTGQKRATLHLSQDGQQTRPGEMPVAPRVLFSVDGKYIAASGGNSVAVWDVASSNTVVQTRAVAVAFSPDSRTVLLGRSDQGTPVLHDLGTGSEESFAAHLSPVLHVDVTADGRWAVATNAPPDGVRVWDLVTGELATDLQKCPDGSTVQSARASPTQSLAAVMCSSGAVRMWNPSVSAWGEEVSPAAVADIPASPIVNTFAAKRTYFYFNDRVRFSADGRFVAVAHNEGVSVVDLTSHAVVGRITTAGMEIPREWDGVVQLQQQADWAQSNSMQVDPKTLREMGKNERDEFEASAAQQRSAAASLRQQMSDPAYVESLRAGQRQVSGVALDESRHLLATARGGLVTLWNFETGERLRVLNEPSGLGMGAIHSGLDFSADGQTLCAPGSRWATATGKVLAPTGAPDASAGNSQSGPDACHDGYSAPLPDGGPRIARSHGNLVGLVDSQINKSVGDLAGHRGLVTSVASVPDGKSVISSSEDGSLRIWNVAERKEVMAFYGLGGMDYVAMTPEQYYRASRARLAGISFRVKDQLYPFEQFDLRFNRPDIVVERLGRASQQDLAEYRSARERRLKKMGFTEAMLSSDFHVPQAEIVGDLPASKTAADSLMLRVKATDERYPLDRINVFVNDVPVFGTRGVAVTDRQSKSYEQQLTVPLVTGINKIQVSVLNQQGAESLKRTLYTTSTAAPARDTYVVAIGVSQYKDSKYNLRFAAKDATDLMSLYSQGAAGGQVHLLDLTNEKATRARVEHAREWLAQSRPNDLVIVFAAGHGITDAQNNYYFGTYDIDPAQPQVNGLPYEEFETLLDGIPAMKKLLLLDTCFSGEIEKDDAPAITLASDPEGTVKMRAFQAPRGVVLAADPAPGSAAVTGTDSAALAVGTRHFQNLFADLRRGVGAVVISSASGNEYALEGDHWNNGVFTYAVLHGLKDGKADSNKDGVVTVAELQNYVIGAVRELTAGGQNPTVREANLDFDFRVY